MSMIRPWNRRKAVSNHFLAFHELDDDVDHNAQVGRAVEDASLSSVSSSNRSCTSGSPILSTSPSLFANFWKLTVPVLPRPCLQSHCRHKEPPRQRPREHGQIQEGEAAVNTGQEWKEASRYLDSVIIQAHTATDTEESKTAGSLEYYQSVQLGISDSSFKNRPQVLVTPPPTPPFCDGHCSTIVQSTPENRAILLSTESSVQLAFAESPPPPSPPVMPSPRQVSPESGTSLHSNPPYIPPVGTETPASSGSVKTSSRSHAFFNIHTSDLPPEYHSPGSTGGVRLASQIHQISNPPPLKFSIVPPASCRSQTMEEISSLGEDSLGETPSTVFQKQQLEDLRSTWNAMATTAHTTDVPNHQQNSGDSSSCGCCFAWLLIWFRRTPRMLRLALVFGTALWVTAAALVALAIAMGSSNNRSDTASSAARDWQNKFTFTPAKASQFVPTLSPSVSSLPKESAEPTIQPTYSRKPTSSPVPNHQTTAPSASPSARTSSSPTMKIRASRRTLQPTMAPSLYSTSIMPGRPTHFPTFEPPRGM